MNNRIKLHNAIEVCSIRDAHHIQVAKLAGFYYLYKENPRSLHYSAYGNNGRYDRMEVLICQENE
ncbi:hypothetical protein ACFSVM_03550 [Paenibacillus shunpengii]|uniref:Uncharacterized protein n=1 Tax=Paenibacillus shunpengii TaxID=2054424 RepID=A0ABW5SIJ0_9BACL